MISSSSIFTSMFLSGRPQEPVRFPANPLKEMTGDVSVMPQPCQSSMPYFSNSST